MNLGGKQVEEKGVMFYRKNDLDQTKVVKNSYLFVPDQFMYLLP